MNILARGYNAYKLKVLMFMLAVMAGINYYFNIAWASQPSNMHSDVDGAAASEAFDRFFADWKTFLAFLSGFATLTCILAFIVLMIKLSTSDSIIERPRVLREILVVLVVAALTGSATVVFALLTTGLLT